MKIHHLALQVNDLEKARAFYVGVLGLALVREQAHALWVQAGETIVMLEKCADDVDVDDGRAWASDRCGLFCVAFAITAGERDALKQRLRAAGVVIDHESGFTVYVRDPFGARLGFSHHPEPQP